jgi:DNA-binding IclR family transcriptional regulator
MTSEIKILNALRQSNTAMTQGEIATATDLDAKTTREACYSLCAGGHITYQGGWYRMGRDGNEDG